MSEARVSTHDAPGSLTDDAAPAMIAGMRRIVYPGFAVGVALFTVLLVHQGVGEVLAALAVGGWGLLGVALFHLAPMVADALGWRTLLVATPRPQPRTMVFARWVGESINTLLPAMQVGGNIAKARVLGRRGIPGVVAGASVVVDVTLVMLTQIVFTITGLLLLLVHVGGHTVAPTAAIGLGLSVLGLAGFVAAQRMGLFTRAVRAVSRMRSGVQPGGLVDDAAALDAAVAALYRDRRCVATAGAWHLLSWAVGVGEVWLALRLLGHPVDLLSATILESLAQAIRGAAFAVPAALGVQEGGFLLLGATLGIAPDTALALSLTKRVREISLGLPGLVAWQLDWTLHRRRAAVARGVKEDR
ncbi:MAG TPA: lysylphosphatidylglycerol synthase domain-containing protein [Candidatus Binatia bacterium]|jgi:putative membrane protein|nr:lysylphosphatidylglycerol synthase domain-containing protein [Candidatus Binatia bacterium]